MTFFALRVLPRAARARPALIGALAVGTAAVWGLGSFKPPAGALFAIAQTNLYVPRYRGARLSSSSCPRRSRCSWFGTAEIGTPRARVAGRTCRSDHGQAAPFREA